MKEPSRCKTCNKKLNILNKCGYCRICYRDTKEFKAKARKYSDSEKGKAQRRKCYHKNKERRQNERIRKLKETAK